MIKAIKRYLIASLFCVFVFLLVYQTISYWNGNYLPEGFYTSSMDHEGLDVELKCSKKHTGCSVFETLPQSECVTASNCDPIVVGGGVLDYQTNQKFIFALRMVVNTYECDNSFSYEYTDVKQYWAINIVENKRIGPMNDLEFAEFLKQANLVKIELRVPKNYYNFSRLKSTVGENCKKTSWPPKEIG